MVPSADDDDFFQSRALGQHKTSGLRLETATRKSSQPTVQPIQAEVPSLPKGKICCRCIPRDVIEAIGYLDEIQKERVRAMGWGTFLDITVDAVESRELFLWLLDKVDVNSMMLNVLPNVVLPLNKAAVQTVLGVPSGSRSPPKKSNTEILKSKKELAAALGVTVGQLSIEKLKDQLKLHRDDVLSIRCFFIIVFNKLLFPTTNHSLSSSGIELTMDFENFKEVDWQQAILNSIKTAAKKWQHRAKHSANPSISACAPFLLIYYLDNLDHSLNCGDRLSVPRTKLFERKKIEMLTTADKSVDSAGCIKYGNLQLKDPTGSVYQGIISTSDVNPTSRLARSQQTTRSDHATSPLDGSDHTTSPLDGIVQMPSLGELVKEFMCHVPAQLSDQFSKLVTTFDERVHAKQVIIHQCQQDTKDLILNFSHDIQKLLKTAANTCTEGVESEGGPSNQIPVGLFATSSTKSQECSVLDVPEDGVPMVRTAVASPPSSNLPSSPIIDQNMVTDDAEAAQCCVQKNLYQGQTPPSDVQKTDVKGGRSPDKNQDQSMETTNTQDVNEPQQPQVQTLETNKTPDDRNEGFNKHIVCCANPVVPSHEQMGDTAMGHSQTMDKQDGIGSSEKIDAQDGHNDLAFTEIQPEVGGALPADVPVEDSYPVPEQTRARKRSKIIAGLPQTNVLSSSKKRRRQKPLELVSPLKLGRQRTLPDPTTTIALRDTICAEGSPYTATSLMQFDMDTGVPYTGEDIKGSFQDGSDTEVSFLEDCMNCLAYDDASFRKEACGGYRVFLGPHLCFSLNPEEFGKTEPNKVFRMDALVESIRRYLPKSDFQRIKMINMVMHHREHLSVYCINCEQKRIDILDSINYKAAGSRFTDHHDKGLMDVLMSRLSEAFQKISTCFPIFGNWRRVRINEAPVMKQCNDCAACTMFYLEYYDGSSKKLLRELDPDKASELRCGMLHYMVFHPTNCIKKLPDEIEKFRQPGVPF